MTANAGYKAYATGDVLTAAQVQYNLQNQTVMYFATTTARDAALTGAILVEGMVSYTPATGLMYYNGTAWTAVGGSTIPTSYGFTAGKNKVLNADFNIWQRGTSGSSTGAGQYVGADRFNYGTTGTASAISQQTFTPGTAPVSGYEGTYYSRTTGGAASTYIDIGQWIENVQTYAGTNVTFTFWAKSSVSLIFTPTLYQNFGSGGSTQVTTTASNVTLTSSWVRYTASFTVPSIAGKTIGTSSKLGIYLVYSSGVLATTTFDTWGWQLEPGTTASSFAIASSSLATELAACQRYYIRNTPGVAYGYQGTALYNNSGSGVVVPIPLKATMRVVPTSLDYGNLRIQENGIGSVGTISNIALASECNANFAYVSITVGSGVSAARAYILMNDNNTAGYLGFSAEL